MRFSLFGVEDIYAKGKVEKKEDAEHEKSVQHLTESETRYEALVEKFKKKKKITKDEFEQCGRDIMKDKDIMDGTISRIKGKLISVSDGAPPFLLKGLIPRLVDEVYDVCVVLGERKGVLKMIGYNLGYLSDND